MLTPSNCFGAAGLQIAIYQFEPTDSTLFMIDCASMGGNVETLQIDFNGTSNPNQVAYLLIDGYGGDICDFTISVDCTPLVCATEYTATLSGPTTAGTEPGNQTTSYQLSAQTTQLGCETGYETFEVRYFGIEPLGEVLYACHDSLVVQWNTTGTAELYAEIVDPFGCAVESSVPFTVEIAPPDTATVDTVSVEVSICEGDCFSFEGTQFCEAGTYEFVEVEGNDTLVSLLTLELIPAEQTDLQIDVAAGTILNGQLISSDTLFSDTLIASTGCDSIVNTSVLAIVPSPYWRPFWSGEIWHFNSTYIDANGDETLSSEGPDFFFPEEFWAYQGSSVGYEQAKSHFHSSTLVDSITVNAVFDTTYHLRGTVENIDYDQQPDHDCGTFESLVVGYPKFLGQTLQNHGDSLWIFHHPLTERYLRPHAQVGTSWTFDDSGATISVTAVTEQFILEGSVIDSVKTMVSSEGDTIQLSRLHGILRWPTPYDQNHHFYNIGLQNKGVGDTIPSIYTYPDHELGDSLFYYCTSGFQDDVFVPTWKLTEISATIQSDSLAFLRNSFPVLPISAFPPSSENELFQFYGGDYRIEMNNIFEGTYFMIEDSLLLYQVMANIYLTDEIELFPQCYYSPEDTYTYSFLPDYGFIQSRYVRPGYIGGNICTLVGITRDGVRIFGELPLNVGTSDRLLPENAVLLSPNPASETVRIRTSFSFHADDRLTLFSAAGHLVQNIPVPVGAQEHDLDVTTLPPGVYTLRVQHAGKIGRRRLVVVR